MATNLNEVEWVMICVLATGAAWLGIAYVAAM
jgi:hypothetical protein